MVRYKIKKDFIVDKIEGKITIFSIESSTFYNFNETGTYIFDLFKKNLDKRMIIQLLVKKYQISNKKAEKDISEFLNDLLKNKIIFSSKQKK